MVARRTLPERRNPLVDAENSPAHDILVERRRLGQTNLSVKQGTVGVTSAAQAENLGTFDYAHLRVPLPKDLGGSGIFTFKSATSYPESYFLMRRSSDGYVSATGMFKAAFPWAALAEEEAERKYQKTLSSAGHAEVAGSVWIAPEEALLLADEYGMRTWIMALLDPEPIEKGTKGKSDARIQTPPKFDLSKVPAATVILPPTSTLRATRARSTRSSSPSKITTPSRKMASPRKRTTRASKASSVNGEDLFQGTKATSVSNALQVAVENGTPATESVASSVNGEAKDNESVRIEVQETVEQQGDTETTTTNVKIDVPSDHQELPEPEDPMKMIEDAKQMVAEANKLESKVSKTSKRKAQDLLDANEAAGPSAERPAKLARTMSTTEQKLAKEKVTRRALVGLGVMAAVGYVFSTLTL
ncbi:hypothetical protein P280DRAFT_115810 [Massarina eburnea CBS 473.64]|uniref:HTH APSES-type domain-containing protein n=1 Tax=Massarina eburnea CBS 473.64 TaxID=1395130 RepID=A0A6A6SBM2_9PLEO|nr:hypothetical protein P280DRAFT_115810 [Massarina eburnea CBS 473.64]